MTRSSLRSSSPGELTRGSVDDFALAAQPTITNAKSTPLHVAFRHGAPRQVDAAGGQPVLVRLGLVAANGGQPTAARAGVLMHGGHPW